MSTSDRRLHQLAHLNTAREAVEAARRAEEAENA